MVSLAIEAGGRLASLMPLSNAAEKPYALIKRKLSKEKNEE